MKPYHGVDVEPKTSLAGGEEPAKKKCRRGNGPGSRPGISPAIVATTGARLCGRSNRIVTNVLISRCSWGETYG